MAIKLRIKKTITAKKTPGKVKNIIITNEHRLKEFVDELLKSDYYSFDIETADSLDVVYSPSIVGVSFYSDQAGDVGFVPIGFNSFPNQLPIQTMLNTVAPLFNKPGLLTVAHNAKFDCAIMEWFGIKVRWDNVRCSQVLSNLANENKLSGLKARILSEFGHKMTTLDDLQGKRGTKAFIPMVDLDVEDVANYCGEDAFWCYRLFTKLVKDIDGDKFLGPYYEKMESPFVKVLERMHYRGVHLDLPFLRKLDKKVGKLLLKAEASVHKIAKIPLNLNSAKQKQVLLFDRFKLHRKIANPMELDTNKSGYATNAYNLDILKGTHPIIDHLLEYNRYAKLKQTYTSGLQKKVGTDKKIHCNFNQTVVVTGRLSSSAPNLQNIPSRSALGKQVRLAFRAPKGKKFIVADYSNIELRLLAHMSQDPIMLEKFRNGEDLHTLTASSVYKLPLNQCDKTTKAGAKRREDAKTLNFGILYGMKKWSLSKRLNVSEEEAEAFIEDYFGLYQGVREWIDKIHLRATKLGYVRTLFGRMRRLPEAQLVDYEYRKLRNRALRQSVNFIIQGTQAEIIKLAMCKIERKIKLAKLRMQVHDELVATVPEEDADAIAKDFKRCMMFPTKDSKRQILDIPMDVDLKIVDRWGEAK